ncbi:MAG: hypothetical protein ACKO7B_10425, partial [Flavobacteriales bacterium]
WFWSRDAPLLSFAATCAHRAPSSYFFLLVVLFCIPWNEIFPAESRTHQRFTRLYKTTAPAINVAFIALCTVMLADATYNPFIYFRF